MKPMLTARMGTIVALAAVVLSCGPPYSLGQPARGPVEPTSLVAILADPERFDGRRVWVAGVVRFEFEGNGLFLTREHHRHRLHRYAVWLDPNLEVLRATPDLLSKLDGRFVLLEGEVDASCHGHGGSYPACIRDITQMRTVD